MENPKPIKTMATENCKNEYETKEITSPVDMQTIEAINVRLV